MIRIRPETALRVLSLANNRTALVSLSLAEHWLPSTPSPAARPPPHSNQQSTHQPCSLACRACRVLKYRYRFDRTKLERTSKISLAKMQDEIGGWTASTGWKRLEASIIQTGVVKGSAAAGFHSCLSWLQRVRIARHRLSNHRLHVKVLYCRFAKGTCTCIRYLASPRLRKKP